MRPAVFLALLCCSVALAEREGAERATRMNAALRSESKSLLGRLTASARKPVPSDEPKPLEPAAPDAPKQPTTTTPTQPAGDPGATIGTTSTASAAATATKKGPGACAAAAVKTSLTTAQQKSLCTHMSDSSTPAACFQLIESKPVHGMKFSWDDMVSLCLKPNSHDAPHACLEQQHTKDATLSAQKLVEVCAGAPAVKNAAGRASQYSALALALALALGAGVAA